jgi:ABC-2 type transport system permease protein
MGMKKYWTLAKLSFQQQLIYRGNILIYRFGEFANTTISFLVLVVLYGSQEAVEGYTLAETITYIAGVGVIGALSRTWVADEIERDVHRGRLSTYLLKPIEYFRLQLTHDIARKQISGWFSVFTYILVIFLVRQYFIVNTDILRWLLFFVSIGCVVLLRFLLLFMIGLFSFWLIRIGGVQFSFDIFLRIMSGSTVPLEFFPPTLETAARLLPFAYMQYFSMQIYLERISTFEAVKGIGIQLFWIAVLAFLAKIFWQKALKRYESVGI